MSLYTVVYWSFVACLAYIVSVYVSFALMLIISAAEARRLARQDRHEDYDTIAGSSFTIPVTVCVPAYNEEVLLVSAVRSLLAQEYPEFEIVVVNDGSTDGTLLALERAFGLERREIFYRRVMKTKEVRGIYLSRAEPRLIVVDKENGGKADALNCGLNLARYRYACTVDADTVFHPHALLKGMRLALKDPLHVVGVTSQLTITRHPSQDGPARAGGDRVDDTALTSFQKLDYLRAFLNNRIGWSRLDFMLCSVGAFAIWRRDVLEELGGFSPEFTCEDIEMTFRVHEHFRRNEMPYRVASLGDSVGRSEGPDTVGRLVSQRGRWQRVITETVWHYRRMFLNPSYGTVGLIGMPYYVLVEVLAPFFQVLAVLSVPLAWWLGVLNLAEFVLFLLTVTFTNGVLTNFAIYRYDLASRSYRLRDLVRLMVLGPLDLFIYRPILVWAQAKGVVDFLRGDKRWHKFERNRPAAA